MAARMAPMTPNHNPVENKDLVRANRLYYDLGV